MSLFDSIKQKHAKSFFAESQERINDFQFSCFIDKPFYYLYSLDMMNKELKKNDLIISKIKHSFLKITFTVTRL